MKRLRYLAGLLDRRDGMMFGGFLCAALVVAFTIGHVTAVHRERVERERILSELRCDGRNTLACLTARSR